ncbi:uncharacterized protein LOC124384845 isoform X2 [Silurus meridionalis]|uniref:Uncharacterized protein n=1 Tax=Silurus meridionalis TaxID=175797 RepID=A0A8T0BNS3_SILME|nr:uncharacterized protein LOC124384845 isoform X2 [Silurus meridionalis]KAF7708759.1 hypothetical protein HF521_017816 [Silurus meridionalis]
MAPSWKNLRSALWEGAVCFVLGAVGGCALGATVTPVHQAMTEIISGSLLKPVMDGVRTIGPLGLGTLLGATALSTTMTTSAAGVTVAALVTLLIIKFKKNESPSGFVLIATGLAASLGTTSFGAALGVIIEKYIMRSGVVALLWALGILIVFKAFIHIVLHLAVRERTCCSVLDMPAEEQFYNRLDFLDAGQLEKVTVEIEQMLIILETEKSFDGENVHNSRVPWETQGWKRVEMKQHQNKARELTKEQRRFWEHLTSIVVKYVEFLTFSGFPMTVSAAVTAGFGIFGFGDYRFVFVVLITLVLCMAFLLMRSMHLNFWMFTACVGMFATFAIAVLTVHAGQEVLEMSVRMQKAGQVLSRENISARMEHKSSVEAIASGFFVSKMFQIALGATVGGSVDQKVLDKVIVGAAVTTVALLSIVEALSVALGIGGVTGALLGAVGTAGVSMGGAAAVALRCSSWAGTISTTAGMLSGAFIIGNWDITNIGLQVLVAYVFAMISPY